jgi:hypothetical protein
MYNNKDKRIKQPRRKYLWTSEGKEDEEAIKNNSSSSKY